MSFINFLIRKNKNFSDYVDHLYIESLFKREDKPVLDFLDKIKIGEYLEVGSGLGRFPAVVKKMYNFNITCLEINNELAEQTRNRGFKTINNDILDSGLDSESYDIVHCSHLIEHFSYPQITSVLDELIRLVKFSGYVIIRSPLMNKRFYYDIDHFKPYPPESIINYFNAIQQKKKGKFVVKEISRWYRKKPFELIGHSEIIKFANALFKIFWTFIKIPFACKTGYVLIIQKK